ncbi:unnamed protein product [Mucor hiemalis]
MMSIINFEQNATNPNVNAPVAIAIDPASSSTDPKSWQNDPNESGKTSYDILIGWMTAEGNYAKYCGPSVGIGETSSKAAMCKQIADLLVATGHIKRKPETIREAIRRVKASFEYVRNELKSTRYGVQDEYDVDSHREFDAATVASGTSGRRKKIKTIEALVNKKCKYYYDLINIFCMRPTISLAGVSCSVDSAVVEVSDSEEEDL